MSNQIPPVDAIHVGPQKAATTWVYTCLRSHPRVACAVHDSVHFFDINYHRGHAWYLEHFQHAQRGQVRLDITPSYLRSPWVPERIHRECPEVKILVCLRNPVERAFSHYWHEKKKGIQRYPFRDVLRNYDLFASWLEPGFYASHLERFFEWFARDQILIQVYDDLTADAEPFLGDILTFLDVDTDFSPPGLNRRVNMAGPRRGVARRVAWQVQKRVFGHKGAPRWINALSGRSEYTEGVDQDLHAELLTMLEPEISRLESLLGRNLDTWRDIPPALGSAAASEAR